VEARPPTVCTAVALRELALARVLAGDLERVHPGWRLTALVLDGDPPAGEPFEAVGREILDDGAAGPMEALTDGPRALAAALRPALMAALAERRGGVAIWIDPTVRLFGPLDAVVGAAGDGVALVPRHGRLELPCGLGARGPFESGVVAGADLAALHWWDELLRDAALRRGAAFDPLAEDLLGALAGAVERTSIVRDAGIAGWWSLAAGGKLEQRPWRIDGAPLSAFNLAGFDPARPHWLSSEDVDGRARISDNPALAALLPEHVQDLTAAGWEPDTGEWRYSTLPGDVRLDDDLRDLLALARREGAVPGDPFGAEGCAALLDWIDGESSVGAGVGRYLERVHRRRADLQIAFPDVSGGDGPALAAWERAHGVGEEPVLAALAQRRSGRPGGGLEAGPGKRADRGPSVRVVGYFDDGLGLGEAARAYVRALAAAGTAVEAVTVPAPMEQPRAGRPARRQRVDWRAPAWGGGAPPTVEIVCVNPPELLRLHQAGLERRDGVHRIGVWAWELDAIPAEWTEAFGLVDEIWVYSEYVARALREAPVPVTVMPLAIDVERLERAGDARRGGRSFTFLFVFDLLSSLERKNPLGLIDAFRRAFAPGEGARLTIKASNGHNQPEQLERLRVAALGRPDIEIVDAFLSTADRDALIASCDCYVSLHRAEGFGLTLAEAMAAGRPTIATGFSGNLDFMSADTAWLVDWRPAPVEAGSAIYTAGARWAEPDVEQAAELMRWVCSDPAAGRRAEAGRERVRRLLAPGVVGARVGARLAEIEASAPGGVRAGRIRAALGRRRATP
jgi:glycosyltransferase involved in cell wall biosynthesis